MVIDRNPIYRSKKNIVKEFDYWDKLLHQYAGMAMQGILAANAAFTADDIAKWSIEYATALVEKLKEEHHDKESLG